jgi:hypothetical protein
MRRQRAIKITYDEEEAQAERRRLAESRQEQKSSQGEGEHLMRERFTAVWPHWGLTALISEIPTAEQLSYIHYQTTRA